MATAGRPFFVVQGPSAPSFSYDVPSFYEKTPALFQQHLENPSGNAEPSAPAPAPAGPSRVVPPPQHPQSQPPQAPGEEDPDALLVDPNFVIKQMEQALNRTQRPNVLLAGATGAGKSTIVNTVFECNLAAAGAGNAITQHYERFALPDKPVCVYDSKGVELGNTDAFLKETKRFIRALTNPKLDIADRLHVVWYVVNAADARFQNFEKQLCRKVFSDLPIVFVLNKCDLMDPEDMQKIRAVIEGMRLKRCCGVFEVCARRRADLSKVPENCPQCRREVQLIDKKAMTYKCSAGHTFVLPARDTGLDQVVEATIAALPVWAAEAFAAAQRVSVFAKAQMGRAIIRHHVDRVKLSWNAWWVQNEFLQMVMRLGALWSYFEYSSPEDAAPNRIETIESNVRVVASKEQVQRVVPNSKNYWSFFRCLLRTIAGLLKDATDLQARVGAEGILLYLSFAEAYTSAANRVLGDVNSHLGQPVPAHFTPPDPSRVHEIKRCILEKGINTAFATHMKKSLPEPPVPLCFGVGVETLPCEGSAVPEVFDSLLTALYEPAAIQTEGIFRVPGSKVGIEALKCHITRNGRLDEWELDAVHDVAGVLKLWLKELPSPLVPFAAYEPIINAQRAGESASIGARLVQELEHAPPAQVATLVQLLQFLAEVAAHSNDNKMTPANLGMVFGPNVLRPEEDPEAEVENDLRAEADRLRVVGEADRLRDLRAKADRLRVVGEAVCYMITSYRDTFAPFAHFFRS